MQRRFTRTFCLFIPLIFAASAGVAWAQAPRLVMAPSIGPLAGKGPLPMKARLLLRLRVASEDGARPEAVRAVQDEVLSRLGGTSARLLRRYGTPPALAVEIGPDALPALMRMGKWIEEMREDPTLVSVDEEKTLAVKAVLP
jgi:hypothetical protein